jgi:hypothetical protein
MDSKTLMKDVIIVLDNTHINGDSNITAWILDQDSLIMPKGVDASASYSDPDTDNKEHCDGGPSQVEQIDDDNEFRDIEFEDLVLLEGPQLILQLKLHEHVDGFMEEEIIDANDYAN